MPRLRQGGRGTHLKQLSATDRKTCIRSAIKVRMDAGAKRTEITQDRVLKEYARIAFLDPR